VRAIGRLSPVVGAPAERVADVDLLDDQNLVLDVDLALRL